LFSSQLHSPRKFVQHNTIFKRILCKLLVFSYSSIYKQISADFEEVCDCFYQ